MLIQTIQRFLLSNVKELYRKFNYLPMLTIDVINEEGSMNTMSIDN